MRGAHGEGVGGWRGGAVGWGFEVIAIDFARSKNRSERVNSVMDYKGRRDARQRKEYCPFPLGGLLEGPWLISC